MTRFVPGLPAVFLGPSLSRDEAARILPANYFGPAEFGDVYRLISSGVRLVVLIDGVFHLRPAVWPREILEAIDEGLTVVGGGSMGALRAAELHTLGMIGRGSIFEWYRTGVIDGDDEVALLHTDAASGFLPLSLPLVDVRHRAALLVQRGQLAQADADVIIARQKRRAFGDRTSRTLQADAQGLFGGPWPTDSLKRADAIEVLRAAAELVGVASSPRPAPVGDMYAAISRRCRGYHHAGSGQLRTVDEILHRDAIEPELARDLDLDALQRFFLRQTPQWRAHARHPVARPPDPCFPSAAELMARQIDAAVVAAQGQDGVRAAVVAWARDGGIGPPDLGDDALYRWLLDVGPESLGFLFAPLDELMAAELDARGDLERLSGALAEPDTAEAFAAAPEVARVRLARGLRLTTDGEPEQAIEILWPLVCRRPLEGSVRRAVGALADALAASTVHAPIAALHQQIRERWARCDKNFGDFGLFYQSYDRVYLAGHRDSTARWRAYALHDLVGAGTEVLDVGCNTGVMGLMCAEHGSRVEGFDADPNLVDIARDLAAFTRAHAHFHTCTVRDFSPSRPVELILSCAVHRWADLPGEEYARRLRSWLAPGGHVLLESQGMRWRDAAEPEFDLRVEEFVGAGFQPTRSGELCDDGVSLRRFVVLQAGV